MSMTITNKNYISPTKPWDVLPSGWCPSCKEMTDDYNRYGECNACGTSLYESKEAAEEDTCKYCKRPGVYCICP